MQIIDTRQFRPFGLDGQLEGTTQVGLGRNLPHSTAQAKRHAEGATFRSSARQSIAVVGVGIATLGPYVAGSVRTEQIAVYGLFLLALPLVLIRPLPRGGGRLLAAWTMYVIAASLGTLFPADWEPFSTGNVLAGYDNILLPIALMLLVWATVHAEDGQTVLRSYLRFISVAMAVNGILALISTAIDVSTALRGFWAIENADATTAGNAATMGRYSGIFNQPAEAGFMYGIAGLAAVYVWRRRPILLGILLVAISVGGIVSVSKVFVFGGLPLIALYWLLTEKGARRAGVVIALPIVAVGLVQLGLLDSWAGREYFGRLFDWQPTEFVTLVSGGRTDADSVLANVTAAVMLVSPLVGVGAAGWVVPYDGALAEALIVGGILGAGVLSVVLTCIVSLPRALAGGERVFALMFAILLVGGCLGFSPLTANRTSTTAWTIIALLVLVVDNARKTVESASERTRRRPPSTGSAQPLQPVRVPAKGYPGDASTCEPGRSGEPLLRKQSDCDARPTLDLR